MMRKVVVGDDGGPGGRDALALARALAPEAELVLAGVYPHELLPGHDDLPGYDELLRRDTIAALQRTRDEAGVTGARIAALGDRSCAHGLQRFVTGEGADLLVVGTSHRGPVGRNLLGDVARGALLGAPCAVAVAPRSFEGAAPRSVGLAFDDSAEARAALAVAADLARRHDARLIVRYIVEEDLLARYAAILDIGAIYEDARAQGERLVADALAPLRVASEGSAVIGDLAGELAALAEAVDVLVCGSRGFGPVRRVVLGSTADRLIHHAPCPVVVVPRSAVSADD
jgi:nucleotide-binding universal stress UspA family protein